MSSCTPGCNEFLSGQNDRKRKANVMLFKGYDINSFRTTRRQPVIQNHGCIRQAAVADKRGFRRVPAMVFAKEKHCNDTAKFCCFMFAGRLTGNAGKKITDPKKRCFCDDVRQKRNIRHETVGQETGGDKLIRTDCIRLCEKKWYRTSR